MREWLQEPQAHTAAYRLGWTLLHTLWIGAAVWGVFEVAMRLLHARSAQARYLTGCAALAVMLAAPIGIFWMMPAPPAVVNAAAAMHQDGPARSVVLVPTDLPEVSITKTETASVAPASSSTPARVPEESWAERARQQLDPILPVLVLFWAAGVGVLSLWHVVGWMLTLRLRRAPYEPVNLYCCRLWQDSASA